MAGTADARSSRLYPERPLPGDQTSLERDALVDTLLELIGESEAIYKGKLTVIGLYGERGSGKTSALHGLIERVKGGGSGLRLVLPQTPPDGNATPSVEGMIFDPGLARDKDELPFDLIRFLRAFGRDHHSELPPPLDEADEALAKMEDPERYLDLEKDLVPSTSKLPEAIAKLRVKLSNADKDLHRALTRWGASVFASKKGRLLLLIDDIDLCPELAFPLIDLLTRYLRDVPCVAVLCADEETLLSAVKSAMVERRSPPELARPLLAKHVPLAAFVTPWSAEEAARLLLEGHNGKEPTITDLRVNALNTITTQLINIMQKAQTEPGWLPASGFDEDAARRSWTWLIGRLAPRNPRQLKRLHNRVVMEIDPKPNEPQARPAMRKWARVLWDIEPEELRLIFTFILMVEVTHPELGLWSRVLAVDETLMHDLRMGATIGQWTVNDPDVIDLTPPEHGTPDYLLGRFVDADTKRAWSPVTQQRVADRLVLLCRVVTAVLDRRVWEGRALAISLDADAAALVTLHLPGRLIEALDLRDGQYVRPPVSALWARLMDQRPRLRELAARLRSAGGQAPGAEVVAKAPASVLCWLGWNLRFTHLSVVYNDHNGQLTPFLLPAPRLEAREGEDGVGLFTPHDLDIPPAPGQEDSAPPDDERVLVIDMLRRVSDADITERFDVSPRPMRARRLQMKDLGRPLEPNDYRVVLQDLLDHINHLRKVEGVRVFHLAMVAQDVVAFGLGRQLHSQGVFHLYEWERASQRYVRMGSFPDDETPPTEAETTDPNAPEIAHRNAPRGGA